jgi:starch synthase
MKKILFVSSEAYPLIKTGGLADVSGSLPIALNAIGHDVRLVMPAYASVLLQLGDLPSKKIVHSNGAVSIFEARLPGAETPVWLIGQDGCFDRPGNPYLDAKGKPWPDNAERFSLLCRMAVEIAMNRLGLNWKPDIVHCNDWQTGLIPALLQDEPGRPATVFTIHNLAYQGLFPFECFKKLGLPTRFQSHESLEFYEQLSFIKGGLVYADRVNTVSPNYALEIQGEEFGCGMEGLLNQRADRLSGILNGIDEDSWNPSADPLIPFPYDADKLAGKAGDKAALQKRFRLEQNAGIPVLALVGRLVQQKGIDLVIGALPGLLDTPLQLVVLGSGEKKYEQLLKQWERLYPERIALNLGYDEPLAHLIEAGADMFLMPSRFEPCGLNQMYSQRYGAIPIVRSVGGLADTVEDIDAENLIAATASGVVFQKASAAALLEAIKRALALHRNKSLWKQVQTTGMKKDFSWRHSAQQYEALYDQALLDKSR